jgi:CBS domain-containing protein
MRAGFLAMNEQPAAILQGDYQSMYSPLAAIIRRAPVTVGPEASVLDALQIMERERVGSVIVARPEGQVPLGIFTLHDLLRRVALVGNDLSQPVIDVMTAGLAVLHPHTTAYEAAVTMARHGLRHLLVVDAEQRLVGIVSQSDLFALQRVGMKEISEAVRRAHDMTVLRQCAADIRRLADSLLAQGLGAEPLAHIIATLNDLLTIRLIEITLAEVRLPVVKWCWIALGSEGRLEQTLSTDQDNGLIFEAGSAAEAQRLRDAFLPFAKEVNRRLDGCGFPLCKGNIMAGNPQWCLSLDEWKERFSEWMRCAEPQALLNAAIFFDFRPVFGDDELATALRDWLLSRIGAMPLFMRQMAENALQCQPPLGLIRDFVYDNSKDFPHTLELKMYGSRPFVDAARIHALARGIPHTGTAQRLRAAAAHLRMGREEVSALIDGFHFILLLRLRSQRTATGPEAAANRVNPDELNELDRRMLKESFRQARKLQGSLQIEYRI